ncbi:hypothetical protein [Nostoc sp.]|uniref:hypothetical protein n=1 Tax=Nostoc sp. TaxID=1180 RepID=UPI002FFCBCCB
MHRWLWISSQGFYKWRKHNGDRRTHVYDFWRSDACGGLRLRILKKRCEFIAGLYQKYVENPTPENYFVSLLADYLLEGFYFYNGFIFFYNLSS